jgi:hypothetical protein
MIPAALPGVDFGLEEGEELPTDVEELTEAQYTVFTMVQTLKGVFACAALLYALLLPVFWLGLALLYPCPDLQLLLLLPRFSCLAPVFRQRPEEPCQRFLASFSASALLLAPSPFFLDSCCSFMSPSAPLP